MSDSLPPVACPQCGESQNIMPGGFDADKSPFGPVNCMVCGRAFTEREYKEGLRDARARNILGPRVAGLRRMRG